MWLFYSHPVIFLSYLKSKFYLHYIQCVNSYLEGQSLQVTEWLFLLSHRHVICNIFLILEAAFVLSANKLFSYFLKTCDLPTLIPVICGFRIASSLRIFNTNCNKYQKYALIPWSSLFLNTFSISNIQFNFNNISSYSYFLCFGSTCLLVATYFV